MTGPITGARTARHGLAALLVLTIGAGCRGEEPQVARDAAPADPGPVVAHPEAGGDVGMAALIEGTVTLSSGCLLLGDFPVMWPYGTTWDADREAVVLPDGEVAPLGARVSGGGGFPHVSDLDPQLAERFAGCPLNRWEEVAQFNAGEDVEVLD